MPITALRKLLGYVDLASLPSRDSVSLHEINQEWCTVQRNESATEFRFMLGRELVMFLVV